MTGKKNKTKFISGILIILVLAPSVFFSAPKQADAFWGIFDFGAFFDWFTGANTSATAGSTAVSAGANTTEVALDWKEEARKILIEVAKSVARKALAEMTKSTVNWINSGFHGTPLFLENPDAFFQDIAKSEVKILINEFGYDPSRFPFGKAWALNAINSYKST